MRKVMISIFTLIIVLTFVAIGIDKLQHESISSYFTIMTA